MYGKLSVRAKLKVLTGLHIGASNAFSAIGAVDAPVIRNPIGGEPFIPGSSIKGKLRTLLVRSLKNALNPGEPENDPDEVKHLFGGKYDNNKYMKSRLQFSDAFASKEETSMKRIREIGMTEIKSENTINRITGVANPRQIERVVPGTVFDFFLTYDIEEETEIVPDFRLLKDALCLLSVDYLGGHGTRGYGRVCFRDFSVKDLTSKVSGETVEALDAILKEVEDYAPLLDSTAI